MTGPPRRRATARDLLYFRNPKLWVLHPFLPVTRLRPDRQDKELGVLYDARSVSGTHGYDCTVFAVCLFFLPPTEDELLNGPRYVYDTLDGLADAGWVID